MASFREAIVEIKGRRAGLLREVEGGGTEFVYDETATEPIGIALPLSQRRHITRGGLHPFFQHLTPEGSLRARQARVAALDPQDDFGLLLNYGRDCIGAVSVVNPAARPAVRSDLDPETQAAVAGERTISGVQRKLLAVRRADGRFAPAPATGPAPYIAKLPEPTLPHVVANEALTLDACRLLLGGDAVERSRRAFLAGFEEQCLVVDRFDRTPEGGRLRLEDFAQILARPRGADFRGKYDATYQEVARALSYSARQVLDTEQFFRRLVVFALLGNGDAHLKNFSLLETPSGLRLSPCYDVVNTYFYARQGISSSFGLLVVGRGFRFDEIDREVLVDLGRTIALPDTALNAVFTDIEKRGGALFDLVEKRSPLPDNERHLYADIVRSAWLRIFPPG